MEETKVDETKVEETARIYPSLSQLKICELNKEKHKDRLRYMKDKESQHKELELFVMRSLFLLTHRHN